MGPVVRKTHRGGVQERRDKGQESGVAKKEEHINSVKLGDKALWATTSSKVFLGIDCGSVEQHWREFLPHSSKANLGIVFLGAGRLN